MIGNAWKHLIAGIFVVFAIYVLMYLFGIGGLWWLAPAANGLLMLLVEGYQVLDRIPGHRYDMKDKLHSLLDWHSPACCHLDGVAWTG